MGRLDRHQLPQTCAIRGQNKSKWSIALQCATTTLHASCFYPRLSSLFTLIIGEPPQPAFAMRYTASASFWAWCVAYGVALLMLMRRLTPTC